MVLLSLGAPPSIVTEPPLMAMVLLGPLATVMLLLVSSPTMFRIPSVASKLALTPEAACACVIAAGPRAIAAVARARPPRFRARRNERGSRRDMSVEVLHMKKMDASIPPAG